MIKVTADMEKNAIFTPCMDAAEPYLLSADKAADAITATNTADPMEPATVRREVSSDEASATFSFST